MALHEHVSCTCNELMYHTFDSHTNVKLLECTNYEIWHVLWDTTIVLGSITFCTVIIILFLESNESVWWCPIMRFHDLEIVHDSTSSHNATRHSNWSPLYCTSIKLSTKFPINVYYINQLINSLHWASYGIRGPVSVG